MHDQADELRELVRRAALEQSWASGTAPRRIVVSGGKGGVGTTTVAVNLAAALAAQGQRTVLVDANFNRGGIAHLCELEERETIAAVLEGRRTVHEVLQLGPAGLQILPGIHAGDPPVDCTPAAQERLLHQLSGLGQYAEVMILDVGCGLNQVARRFWSAADLVLLVTTPETEAIMDAYAAIKVLPPSDAPIRIRTLVNLATDVHVAEQVHHKLAEVSYRFLGRAVQAAGEIPLDPAVRLAANSLRPIVLSSHSTPAAQAMSRLADQILQALERDTAGMTAEVA